MDFSQVLGTIIQLVDTLFIYLNALVYDFVSFMYQIFIALAGATVFSSEQYQAIANRIYIIIGVVSLFLISYALLKAIVDSDGTAKSEYSVRKIIPNVIKVVLVIGLTPVVFNMAYKIQNIIINTNVIPRIIYDENYASGSQDENGKYSYEKNGKKFANGIFTSFMYSKTWISDEEIEINACYFAAPDCKGIPNDDASFLDSLLGDESSSSTDEAYTFQQAKDEVNENVKNFQVYANFGSKMHGERKVIEYNPVFQLIAGVVVIYVLINYCIDLGVRAFKLGYYQLVAPIPILSILAPGSNKLFNTWLKSTVTTFVDVFFRIAIFFLALLIIDYLPTVFDSGILWANSQFAPDQTVQNFAKVFLIIGLLIFIKQAPKLISDLFGIQSGSFKLGIKDKIGEMAGVGGMAKKGLEKAEGGITGALGGAYSAAVNRGSIRKGMKTGFWTGLNEGGPQFRRQLQNIYSQGGGKGTAGAFGGQNWTEHMKDRYKDQYKDDYQDRILSARINDATDISNPKSRVYPYFNEEFKNATAKKQKEVTEREKLKNDAEDNLNEVRRKFEDDKQAKLDNLQSTMGNVAGENSRRYVQGYKDFNESKNENLSAMKTAMDTTKSAHTEAMNNTKKVWEAQRDEQVNQLHASMTAKEQAFNNDKAQKLGELKKELAEQYELGNSGNVQKLQAQIGELEASQFDASPYQKQIMEKQNTKFEDQKVYKDKRAEQEAELAAMEKEYERLAAMKYEDTEEYAQIRANANQTEQNFFVQYANIANSKVEDTDEYKEAKSIADEAQEGYYQSYSDLNNKTETLTRWIYDKDSKKLVEKVYNPHYATNGLPKYIDKDDEVAVQQAMVTAVERDAMEEAIKTLKDKSETFKHQDTVFATRINDKKDAAWLKSEEGRHMDILLKRLQAQASQSNDKDDKK